MGAITGPARSLVGTAAVVTGGAGLIGAGIATVLARHGAQMIIIDTDGNARYRWLLTLRRRRRRRRRWRPTSATKQMLGMVLMPLTG
jgi:NAD(P)-dependent dehydrogenase (short-subunit alcohol dehydrogenase family)